jgi:HD-like signal output (HDOD) protein
MFNSGTKMTSEQAISRAKKVAQECAMKATYYRREFTQQARREIVAAALLIALGLILFLRAPGAGFFLFMCGAVAAHRAYTSFHHACTTYGEYKELPEDHN